MSTTDSSPLASELEAAQAEVTRIREENAKLAERFRGDPSDDARELLRRGAASLAAARDRVEAAEIALAVFAKTGSPHGLLAEGGRVAGTIAVEIPAGVSSAERARRVDEALAAALTEAARELGAPLAATPERYTRERPGRDAEGRTVLDVAGRVEGDVLVPAVSKGARNLRG